MCSLKIVHYGGQDRNQAVELQEPYTVNTCISTFLDSIQNGRISELQPFPTFSSSKFLSKYISDILQF